MVRPQSKRIGFKNYLNIAKPLNHPVRVIKDNDGDFQGNIIDWAKDYKECDFIECFSPKDDEQNSLEPALIEANGNTEKELNNLAEIMLSTQTYKKYLDSVGLDDRKKFLKTWFYGKESSSKKVDSAIRIFDSVKEITYPNYLIEAVEFDS